MPTSLAIIDDFDRQARRRQQETPDMASDTSATPPPPQKRSAHRKNPAPKFFKPLSVVSIVVGAAEQKFTIHKDLICHHSPFFRSAFNSRFMEGETQAMTLEDVDPAMFGAVVNWLYTQKIEEMQQDEDGHVVAIREGRLVLLGKLWMLGQRFMMPGFQNKVMSRLRSKVVVCGANDLKQFANYAWDSNSDLLRRFAVDRFATMTEEKVFSDVVDDLPPGLLVDIAKKMKHYYCSLATYDKEKMPDFEGNYKLEFK